MNKTLPLVAVKAFKAERNCLEASQKKKKHQKTMKYLLLRIKNSFSHDQMTRSHDVSADPQVEEAIKTKVYLSKVHSF